MATWGPLQLIQALCQLALLAPGALHVAIPPRPSRAARPLLPRCRSAIAACQQRARQGLGTCSAWPSLTPGL
ncbi:hypothetical protein HDV63DRAFT_387947 [Trichoderma sp. SZMC 28014]